MRVAVIGTGNMGRGLAGQFASRHEVVIGSREPERARQVAQEVGAASGASYREAIEDADAVVLAVNWWDVDETLSNIGRLDGKIVIDVTNPYKDNTYTEHVDLGGSSSAEEIQKMLPGARVVKGWNHIFAQITQSSPNFGGVPATVFICGDDAEAKAAVAGLARDAGYDPVDAGPLSSARSLEKVAALMVNLGYGMGMGPNVALKLLRR